MKSGKLLLILISLVAQACALVDGYKDNQHSWWANTLSADVKTQVNNGEQVEMEVNEKDQTGTVIVLKGDPEYGAFNFVETGEWDEAFEYQQNEFKRVKARIKTTYDQFGNTVSRTVSVKEPQDSDFYTREVVSSQFKVLNADTVFTQEIKTFSREGKLTHQYETATADHRQMLSDRLKKKIRIGRETIYDKNGDLKKEINYRYEDRIRVK